MYLISARNLIFLLIFSVSTNTINSSSTATKPNRISKSKDNATNTASRPCRCSSSSKSSSTTGSLSRNTVTSSTNTNITLLRNLPVREFDKLSPIPMNYTSSSARSSVSSVNSNAITDPLANVMETNLSNSNSSTINHKTDDYANANGELNANTLSRTNYKKLPSAHQQHHHNGGHKTNSGKSEKCFTNSDSNINNHKSPNSDDSLILRISDLANTERRLSSTAIANDTNQSNGNKKTIKTKLRTKTDPHPISSPKKQRIFSSSTTLTNEKSISSAVSLDRTKNQVSIFFFGKFVKQTFSKHLICFV